MEHTNHKPTVNASLHERYIEFMNQMPEHTVVVPNEPYLDLEIPSRIFRDKMHIAGAKYNVTTHIPIDKDTIRSPYRMVFFHGYSADENAYEDAAAAVAAQGIVATTYQSPRLQNAFKALHPINSTSPCRLLCQAGWGATRKSFERTSKQGLDDILSDRVDAIPHSMGGIAATRVALRWPAHFRSVILNEAAGLEKQGLSMMLARLPEFAKEVPGTDLKIILGSLKYIARNPIRTAAEGIAVAYADIRDDVRELKTVGVKSAILVGRKDTLIPAVNVAQGSGYGVADLFGVYGNMSADHLYLQKHPLEAAYAQIHMLKMLHGQARMPRYHDLAA